MSVGQLDALADWLHSQAIAAVELAREVIDGIVHGGLDGVAAAVDSPVPVLILAIVFVASLLGGD